MTLHLAEVSTEATPPPAALPLQDRVYARAFALTVRSEATDSAIAELIELAEGNPHLIGHVRNRLALLAEKNRNEAHADRAVALATYAWLQAIAAA